MGNDFIVMDRDCLIIKCAVMGKSSFEGISNFARFPSTGSYLGFNFVGVKRFDISNNKIEVFTDISYRLELSDFSPICLSVGVDYVF